MRRRRVVVGSRERREDTSRASLRSFTLQRSRSRAGRLSRGSTCLFTSFGAVRRPTAGTNRCRCRFRRGPTCRAGPGIRHGSRRRVKEELTGKAPVLARLDPHNVDKVRVAAPLRGYETQCATLVRETSIFLSSN